MRGNILKAAFFAKKPVHLILYVTSRCNLKCRTCFVDFNRSKAKELELEEIEKISTHFKKLLWLDIGGGEPFLRKDLPDICALFNTNSISIPTNGFAPTQIYEATKRIKSMTKAEVTLSVSIDGFEETNDYIRERGYFAKSLETAKQLKTIKGIRVKINTVLCEKNYNEMIDFMEFIRKFNFDFHSIMFQRGTANFPETKCPSLDKLSRIKNDIFKVWATYDYGFNSIERKILRNYQKTMYEASLRVIKEKRQIPTCLAGRTHLVIYSNGDAAFCEMLKPFGNIREKNLADLLNSKNAKTQKDTITRGNCYCYHNCNMIDNIALNPLQYPKLLSNIWK